MENFFEQKLRKPSKRKLQPKLKTQNKSLGPSRINDYTLNLCYKLTNHLGKGSFASVNKATHKQTNVEYAIKTYNNHKMGKSRSTKVILNEV